MQPTNDELDRAMMEATGWVLLTHENGWERGWSRLIEGVSRVEAYPRKFCHDRNLLPDVLAMVEAEGRLARSAFEGAIYQAVGDAKFCCAAIYGLPMRTIVEAALRACGKWRAEWEGGEHGTN